MAPSVDYRFPDAEGTELDDGKRCRPLQGFSLNVVDRIRTTGSGRARRAAAVAKWHDAANVTVPTAVGLTWKIFPAPGVSYPT